jgi:hypothetical protein
MCGGVGRYWMSGGLKRGGACGINEKESKKKDRRTIWCRPMRFPVKRSIRAELSSIYDSHMVWFQSRPPTPPANKKMGWIDPPSLSLSISFHPIGAAQEPGPSRTSVSISEKVSATNTKKTTYALDALAPGRPSIYKNGQVIHDSSISIYSSNQCQMYYADTHTHTPLGSGSNPPSPLFGLFIHPIWSSSTPPSIRRLCMNPIMIITTSHVYKCVYSYRHCAPSSLDTFPFSGRHTVALCMYVCMSGLGLY